MNIVYKHNTASEKEILRHLKKVDSLFVEDLSKRVNLEEYAKKLYSHAELEEAWHEAQLVGLVAYYINEERKESFISNVSVDIRNQKQGIASILLNQAKTNSIEHSMKSMRVEVANDADLVSFYNRHGFTLQADPQSSNIKTFVQYLYPLVAIRCTVYNHEPYLRECLEGFVMQKTNFPFVAIVHDDASTDGSATIISEYAEKYPDVIKPIYETENQYSKHDGSLQRIMSDAIAATGAKYVAMCEGDDYWTDPYKLQKQVDILEADETLMACCTDCSVVDNQSTLLKEKRGGVVKDDIPGRYNLRDFFRDDHEYPTLSVVFRNVHTKEVREKHQHTANAFLGDWTLWICLMIYGDMYYLGEVTCAYRVNPTSVTHTVGRVARAEASRDICNKVADILPNEYADIASNLRKADWVWISIMFAYRAEKRYLGMIWALFMCIVKCPKSLWRAWQNRKK